MAERETNTAAAPVAPVAHNRPTSADTVTVGCKLPSGLVLQIFVMEDYRAPTPGGGYHVEKRARRLPESYTLNGNAMDVSKMSVGDVPHLIVGGYGITPGIPKDFWEQWLTDNEQSDLVKGGFIFAQPNETEARARARDGAKVRSGLEPIDPAAPGRLVGRAIGGSVSEVQPGTRQ